MEVAIVRRMLKKLVEWKDYALTTRFMLYQLMTAICWNTEDKVATYYPNIVQLKYYYPGGSVANRYYVAYRYINIFISKSESGMSEAEARTYGNRLAQYYGLVYSDFFEFHIVVED